MRPGDSTAVLRTPDRSGALLESFLGLAAAFERMGPDDPPEVTVLTALDANPTLHVSELADRVDGDPRLVDAVCHELEVDGCVRRRTVGRYSITAKGKRRLHARLAAR